MALKLAGLTTWPGLWRAAIRANLAAVIRKARPGGAASGLAPLRWERRHRAVVVVCWLHVIGIFIYGLTRGFPLLHVVIDVAPIAAATALGMVPFRRRRLRAIFTTLATVIASAAIVHLSGGLIEAHFHYFVMIGVISLYQDWAIYACAFTFVVVDHGIAGALASSEVYNHTAAATHPWTWALVHGAFYLAACLTSLVSWWQTEHAAAHDPLTALPNRTTFESRLTSLRARGSDLAVVFVDLDGFKAVNDALGHHVGDELLIAVGQRLQRSVRDHDLVVRLGGDEFAILLDAVTTLEDVRLAGERLVAAFADPFVTTHMPVRVSASVGIATAFDDDERAADLLRNADIAMRSAKTSGKRRYCIFETDAHGGTLLRASLLADLRNATATGAIAVHYQPIIDLGTGAIAGMEALARWDHPVRGPIPPAVFIPLAEEVGLIGEIGSHVLAVACRDAASWPPVGPSGQRPYVSVNLSPWQFHQDNIVGEVMAHVDGNGLKRSQLVLEITETALMDSTSGTVTVLRAFREHGVRLAIDDFGTGYSSLGYLQTFPVDMLKVDKSFIDGIDGSNEDSAVGRAIIRLADTLGLSVVAEGVERPEQAARLRALGCRAAQGHLYAAAKGIPSFASAHDVTSKTSNPGNGLATTRGASHEGVDGSNQHQGDRGLRLPLHL